MDVKDSTTIGPIVVDIQILRRIAFSAERDVSLRSPEEVKRIESAEQRLASMTGLELVRALIDYTRATGTRLKI